MIQPSTCFVVVELGRAMQNMMQERALTQSGRIYKAQTVKGGLGTGGRLGVSGGSTPASKEIPNQ